MIKPEKHYYEQFVKIRNQLSAVTAERDRALAACAEMRSVLEQFDWEDACVTAFPPMSEWEHALSTDYGKGWFPVGELDHSIALLDEWLKAEPGYGETIIRNVKARLEALKGGKA